MSGILSSIGSGISWEVYQTITTFANGLPTSQNALRRSFYSGYHGESPTYTVTRTPQSVTYTNEVSVPEDQDNFTIEWLGWFKPSVTDNYTFTIESDDGSYMWIGDGAVNPNSTNIYINMGGAHGVQANTGGKVRLVADRCYPIRLLFGEQGGGQSMNVTFIRNGNKSIQTIDPYVYSEVPETSTPASPLLLLDASTYSGTGDWLDLGSAGANATMNSAIVNPPTWSSDYGGMFTFDKAQYNYSQLPNIGSHSSFTVAAWFKINELPSQGGGACILTEAYTGGSINYALGDFYGDNSTIEVGYFNTYWESVGSVDLVYSSGPELKVGKWIHLASSVYISPSGSGGYTIYINGINRGGGGGSGLQIPTSSGLPIYLGRRWDNPLLQSSYISADVADIRIWDRDLSNIEIYQLFNKTKHRFGKTFSLTSY